MKARLILYTLAQCDTCRRAVKWLRERDVEFEERPVRETPPSRVELRRMLEAMGGDLRKLFNTSGRDYREQMLGDKLPTLSTTDGIELLSGNGNLVKRPFALGDSLATVGFNPAIWSKQLKVRE